MTFLRVGGHGLVLAPHLPFRLSHLLDGSLLVEAVARARDGRPSPVAAIKLGARRAYAPAKPVVVAGGSMWQFGEGGPLLLFADSSSRIDDVFASIELRSEEAGWTIVTHDYTVALPPGLILSSPLPEEPPLYTLSRPDAVEDELIVVVPRPVAAHDVRFKGNVEESRIRGLSGVVRSATHDYVHDGVAWRAKYYVMSLTPSATLAMTAQARRTEADVLLAAADNIARSFESMHAPPGMQL
jgi:hypothetical protein